MSFNRPSAPAERSAARRNTPQIWSEGRQQPRFDLRAFARVSVLLSRQKARPVLLATIRLCAGAAERMAENTLGPRFARASRIGRALPAREGVARRLTAIGAFLTAAADLAVPPPPSPPAEPEPQAPPLLIARRPRSAELPPPAPDAPPPLRPAEATDFDAPTLAAIRALIADTHDVEPARPTPAPLLPLSGRVLLTRGVPLAPPEPRPPTLAERLAAQAYRVAAGLMAGAVTLVLLPVGLVGAGLIHLRGEDLRDWT